MRKFPKENLTIKISRKLAKYKEYLIYFKLKVKKSLIN